MTSPTSTSPASPASPASRSLRALWPAGVLAVAVVAGAVALAGARTPATDVAVLEPPAATLEELVGRADRVVVGRVTAVEGGRTLSAPADADRALRTQLARLAVDEVTAGPPARTLILEEVAALGDGTPATLGGLGPSQVGDAGLYLLVSGDEPDRVGLVGPQGRFLLDPADPGRLLAPLPDDPLAAAPTALGPSGPREAVRDLEAPR